MVSRIAILGPAGSGKSTLGDRLSSLLSIPVLHLDYLAYKGNWVQVPAEDFRRAIQERIGESTSWIVDGNYSEDARITHWPSTELFIVLDWPYCVILYRLLKRTLWRCWDRGPLFPGTQCAESLRLAFADRESILLYSLWAWWMGKQQMLVGKVRQECPATPVVV
ncbi:hypothetical protein HDU88_008757, partial [Geranomyces variabilis]